jgi:hypothetical protein
MRQGSRRRRRTDLAAAGLALIALAGLAVPRGAAADEVLDWSIAGFAAAAAGGQNPVVTSRTMAMVHLAVHDALNTIRRRYEPYLYEGERKPSADAGAAIAAAARDVLVGVIPGWGKPEQRAKALAMIESAFTTAIARMPDGAS